MEPEGREATITSPHGSPLPTVQLLFPMGGLGTRFADVGAATPKPLIEVDGMPMIAKALSSFDGLRQRADIRPIFVVRTEHQEEFGLATQLSNIVPNAHFTFLTRNTAGAVETCMEAADAILDEHPVVVMDCDLWFRSGEYDARLASMEREGLAGLVLYFKSTNPRYSYAELAEDGLTVVRTAEKVPISNNALIGAYGFGSGAIFKEAALDLLERNLDPSIGFKEYFVSLLFNFVLARGGHVVAVQQEEYHSFGTPEELARYRRGEQSHDAV
jgi:dTDP-glucose pyrophosphorylase